MKPLTQPPDNQQAFDAVIQHFLIEKNDRSQDSDGDCLLRGPHGRMCAVGLLFPDTLYRSTMENAPVFELLGHEVLRSWFSQCTPDLLAELQRWHDEGVWDPLGFESVKRLGMIAAQFNLDVSKVPVLEFQ